MNRLSRTRSQHFVGSPRKLASPLKSLRRPAKRRRLGSALAVSRAINVSDTSESEEEDHKPDQRNGYRSAIPSELLSSSDDFSPRKRKRSERKSTSSGSDSWAETDRDEEKPEFIAESDQHLLREAPAYALHRLRKAELVRLWKVAGMWTGDDEESTASTDEETGDLGKRELVDGLLARRPSSTSPRGLSAAFELKRLRSATSSLDIGATSDERPSLPETSATPRAMPRTRSRIRGKPPPRPGRGNFLDRSKRIGERKARFDPASSTSAQSTGPPSRAARTTPRRPRRRGLTPSNRHHTEEVIEETEDEPTPLLQRLRSRANRDSFVKERSSELDADGEDEDDSPGPSSRLRSRDKPDSTTSIPSRGAKKKAIQVSLGSEEMELDDPDSLPPLTPSDSDESVPRTTRSGRAFGLQSRRKRLRQEAIDDPDMEADDDEEDDQSLEPDEDDTVPDFDLEHATISSLIRLLRDELVQMCEARGIAVGGTKPQLAKALLEWRKEQGAEARSTSSQATARPPSSPRIIHAVASNVHVSGKTTPVLLRDHIHAADPATPPPTDESKANGEAELNFDLAELGLEDSMIKPSQLQKLERIGSGGFKDVYVGKLRGRKVAISEFREHLSEMDIRELKLLAEFSHPNIVRFRGICIPEDSQVHCMLVSELCENGDLFDYIRNVPCPTIPRVLNLMLDIARGLEYLHTRRPAIIHRDCKSSNILINRQGQAKVGDFGLARVKHSTRSMIRSLVGTVNWQAPELWHPAPRYDYKVDVFSAAMVYWEMLAGWTGDTKYPWEGHNEHYIYDAVGKQQRRPAVIGLRKYWGAEPVNLMERMWHQDPAERPTMTDVVADLEAILAEGDE